MKDVTKRIRIEISPRNPDLINVLKSFVEAPNHASVEFKMSDGSWDSVENIVVEWDD